jgi:Tol biopolymer transport system component
MLTGLNNKTSCRLNRISLKVFLLSVILAFLWGFSQTGYPLPARAQSTGGKNKTSIISTDLLANGNAGHPSISSDGRFIVFISNPDYSNDIESSVGSGIYIHDRLKNETTQLPGLLADEIVNTKPVSSRISADGRFIVFSTLTGVCSTIDEISSRFSIYLHDIFSGETRLISHGDCMEQLLDSLPSPTISKDGRFTAFANFSGTSHHMVDYKGKDIQIYDRIRDHNYFTTIPGMTESEENDLPTVKISDNGRIVVYHSKSEPNKIGYYNRVTDHHEYRSFVSRPETGRVVDFDISADGTIMVFATEMVSPKNKVDYQVFLYDFTTDDTRRFTHIENAGAGHSTLALSGDGNYLIFNYLAGNNSVVLYRFNLNLGTGILLDEGSIGPIIDISFDGSVLVYTKEINGNSQVLVWDEGVHTNPTYILAGQVMDSTGHPMALVTIHNDRSQPVRTDESGIFWLNGITPGNITLWASKEGFNFSPGELHIAVSSDIKDTKFVYTHHETLIEAHKDLGMPYNFNRGEIGPFHLFSAGYCTDLVLDAYTWGVDFNIQFALEQDFRAHPWHFYRWRDARNAHDMWRYFSYSGQLQPHENPYQPGDIVFFDWSEDGEIDHVAIVNEINSRNRPRTMYAATGVIDTNPTGLAAELPWEDFHERTVRGFARWSGKYEPIIPELPSGQILQLSLAGAGSDFRVIDSSGKLISASQVGIPGGRYHNWIWEQSISIEEGFFPGGFYLVVISNFSQDQIPYQFTAQFLENGLVNGRIETKGFLHPWEIKRFPLILDLDVEGNLVLEHGNAKRRIDGVLNKSR